MFHRSAKFPRIHIWSIFFKIMPVLLYSWNMLTLFCYQYVSHKPGPFIDVDTGEEVGQHLGIHMWTVGQRCRIGGCLKPYFVASKQPETRTILVVRFLNFQKGKNKSVNRFFLWSSNRRLVRTTRLYFQTCSLPTLHTGLTLLPNNYKKMAF